MARLAGVDIPNEKRIEIALTYIFGVGRTRAKETLAATGINPDIRVKDLTDEQLITLRDYLEGNYKIEGDLRREIDADIRRKIHHPFSWTSADKNPVLCLQSGRRYLHRYPVHRYLRYILWP